jgi:hypothetical protein
VSKRNNTPPPGLVEWSPGRWCHPSDPRVTAVSELPPAVASDPQWRCTKCGQVGTVGRCCGLNTRVPLNDAARAEVAKPKSRGQWAPYRNKTEWRYAQKLASERCWRHISYETVKLRVGTTDGKAHWYLPDFPLVHIDGQVHFHEVKGGHQWRERGLAVLRAAAIANPWAQFWLIEPNASGGWSLKRVEG